MSNRVKFICQKFPELCLVMEPASFETSTSGRSKNVRGTRIEFKRNPYGVGEYVTDEQKRIDHIKAHDYFSRGFIVIAENENDPRLQKGGVKRVDLNQGLRASGPAKVEEPAPQETAHAARPARTPGRKKQPVSA